MAAVVAARVVDERARKSDPEACQECGRSGLFPICRACDHELEREMVVYLAFWDAARVRVTA